MELGILTTRHRTLHSTPVTSSDISKAISLEISVERKQGHHRVQTWEKSANDITPEGRDNMGGSRDDPAIAVEKCSCRGMWTSSEDPCYSCP